jgi:hypothetical protein
MTRRTFIDALLLGIIAVWVGMATSLIAGQCTMADDVILNATCDFVGYCPSSDRGATCDCSDTTGVAYGQCVDAPDSCTFSNYKCKDNGILFPFNECSCQTGC